MQYNYYQAWLEDMLVRHPEVEAAVVVGEDGKSLAHANLGNGEETILSGIAFAMFGTSDTLTSDMNQGDAGHVLLRFKDGFMIILHMEPDVLFAAIFRKDRHSHLIQSPERLIS